MLLNLWNCKHRQKINLNTQIFFSVTTYIVSNRILRKKLRATKSFSFRGKRRKYPEGICRKILLPPFIEDVIRGSICFPTLFVDWYFHLLCMLHYFFLDLFQGTYEKKVKTDRKHFEFATLILMSFEKKETQSSESQNVCIVLLFSSLGRQKSHN